MSGARSGVRWRLAMVAALLAGYLLGWRLPDLWPGLETATGYPRAWAAGAVGAPLWRLDAVAAGRLPRAGHAVAAATLEQRLDGLVEVLHETRPGWGIEVPEAARADVVALIAAYRRVFPTFRRGGGVPTPVLAGAGLPSAELLERAGPALRAALTDQRDELAALWAALQGRTPPPPLAPSRRPGDVVLRLDQEGILGRVRVHGDGRVVVIGPGPEPHEATGRLPAGAVESLATALVAGGFLAPDRYERWLAAGAEGCRWLMSRGRSTVLRRRPAPQPMVVTLSLARVGPLPGAPGMALETVERRFRIRNGFLSSRCTPVDPTVRRLRAALSALLIIDSEVAPSPVPAVSGGEPGVVLPPGGPAVLFTPVSGGVAVITDGRRCGAVRRAVTEYPVSASPTGELVAFRQAAGLYVLDRTARGAPRRIGPPDWYGYRALWSPGGDALLAAGALSGGASRMLLGGRRGQAAVPFGETGAQALAWTADGRGIYYRASRSRRVLRLAYRAGGVVDLELPGDVAPIEFLSPSPDGRFLAYRGLHLIAGQPARSLFTVRLDPATALPRRGARATVVAEGGDAYVWSPAGGSIVYAVRRAIREVGADGRGDRRLAGSEVGECNYGHPRVSPDGRWLVYLRCTSSSVPVGTLYLARRDGTGTRRIGRGGWPVWIPAGAPRPALDTGCPQ